MSGYDRHAITRCLPFPPDSRMRGWATQERAPIVRRLASNKCLASALSWGKEGSS
jgi:hypothetical protein